MQLQRFENPDENKFWEVWIDNVTVFMRFGKTGSQGQTKLKKCPDLGAAEKEQKRFITEKEKQGFSLQSSSAGATAKPKKALKNPELEKAIADKPDSPDGYLVYGDWLSEQGDPLGEFIAVHAALAKKGKDAALQKKANALLKANEASWLGDLAKLQADERKIVWKNGFMEKATLGNEEYAEADGVNMYTALRKSPVSRFLRDLELRIFDADGEPDYAPIIKQMVSLGLPSTLRRLSFNVCEFQISWTSLGDLSKLYPQLPNLEEIDLAVGKMKLGVMNLPKLKTLKIETGGLSKDNLKSVLTGKMPNLETLVLYFGTDEYGCNCKIKDIAPIFDATKQFPKLTSLALCNAEFEDDIAKGIVKAKITKQLTSLDLSKGTMGDDGGQALLDNVKALSHLTKLDVTENFLSSAMVAKLKKAFGKTIDAGKQGTSEDDGYKYVQVSE